MPFITLPYLVRILGADYFGLLAFVTATIAFFNLITDYGFNLTATKEISIHREDRSKVVEIFSSVLTIKFFLILLSLGILSLLVFSFSKLSKDWAIYFLTFGTVIGQAIFPVWFFQGMEKMKYITYLNILAKSFFTILIFIFVQGQNDYYLVPIFTSLGFIISGICSIMIVKNKFGINFEFQSFRIIKHFIKEGWVVFISRFYVSLYTNANVFLLGLITNNSTVGYYSIAEKIVVAIGGMFEPVNQAIYPYLSRLYQTNIKQFIIFVKKISLIFFVCSFFLLLISEYFRDEIVFLISGSYNAKISIILGIFLLRVITFPFGPLFSNTLIIMKRNQEFIKGLKYTVILNILIVPICIYYYGLTGMVSALIIVFIFHVLFYFNAIIKLFKKY